MSRRRSRDQIVERFSQLASITLVAGANNNAVNPAFTSRLATIGDSYQYYRLRSLKFRIHPSASTSSAAVSWMAGVVDTPPSTNQQNCEIYNHTFQADDATVPSSWCSVSREDLAGGLSWYKTIQGSADSSEEIVGYLFFTGSGTNTVLCEVFGEMEFKEAIAPANTPAALEVLKRLREMRIEEHRVREQKSLLKVLGSSSSNRTPGC